MKRQLPTEQEEQALKRLWDKGVHGIDAAARIGTDENATTNLFVKWDEEMDEWVRMYRKAKKTGAI